MSILDVDAYDLTTTDGQTSALQDITEEMNRQYSSSTTLKSLSIAAYGNVSLDLGSETFNKVYSTSILHNLGFSPAFKVYLFDPSDNRYLPLISGDAGVEDSPSLNFLSPTWATSDPKNLNIFVLVNTVSPPNPVQFFYWIFDLPMPTPNS